MVLGVYVYGSIKGAKCHSQVGSVSVFIISNFDVATLSSSQAAGPASTSQQTQGAVYSTDSLVTPQTS